ncbi:MAG: hypothetical protein GTO41_11265 [Burkholderiales bacterium]|nr:hypothetical protein [Burkholderiales bacterium]
MLWLPLLLGVAFTISENLWGPSSWQDGAPQLDQRRQATVLLWMLPLFALTVVFAVRSYRVYLLGRDVQPHFAPISWGMRETRFVIAMAGIFFVFLSAAFIFGTLVALLWPDVSKVAKGPFGLLLILPPVYLAGRFLLAFPALALDHTTDVFEALAASWKMTSRNGWRMVGLCIVLPGVIAWSLEQLAQLPITGMYLISAVAVWLAMPVELALVALSYVTLQQSGRAA